MEYTLYILNNIDSLSKDVFGEVGTFENIEEISKYCFDNNIDSSILIVQK